MASKLNAFLAAVPANSLPSPTKAATSHKAFPSLAIPQIEVDEFDDDKLSLEMEPASSPNTSQQSRQCATTPRHIRGDAARIKSLKYDASHRSLESVDDLSTTSSNQEEGDTVLAVDPVVDSIRIKASAPRGIQSFLATTPATSMSSPMKRLKEEPREEPTEAGVMKRRSPVKQLRRVSTNTALFSKFLRKQPYQDIDEAVVSYFTLLPTPTLSHPTTNKNIKLDTDDNQLDESEEVSLLSTESYVTDPVEILSIFERGELITVGHALSILQSATQIMSTESNVLTILNQQPTKPNALTVVGDLHGQFRDLVDIFHVHHGIPSSSNPYLFLGDYVDRGLNSCEIIFTLLAFKIQFPTFVYLLRGNHECRSLSTFYGFRKECIQKYGVIVYNRVISCFESMPLAARIETSYGTFLAVHGGLSPHIEYVEEINQQINRFMEPGPNGALCDLLWSDPEKPLHKQESNDGWAPNHIRGCSYTFNEQVCRSFLQRNQLLSIIRAHELEEDGFRQHFVQAESFPPVITVFSAPEYCNTNQNMGATLVIPWTLSPHGILSTLEYKQHERSQQKEVAYIGPCEHEAVMQLIKEQLPYLPMDFYELVSVCRDIQTALEVASASTTPVVSSADVLQVGATTNDVIIEFEPNPIASEKSVPPSPSKERRKKRFTLCPGVARFFSRCFGSKLPTSHPCANTERPSTADATTTCTVSPSISSVSKVFTPLEWQALRLFFSLLDTKGTGILTEESFVVLLAEQDSDAYATQTELSLLTQAFDANGDGSISEMDFLQFAYRACLRWKKHHSNEM